MHDSVIIRTPIPTPEEMADTLGVPRSRLKWLRSMLIEQGSLPARKRSSSRSTAKKGSVAKKQSPSGRTSKRAGKQVSGKASN